MVADPVPVLKSKGSGSKRRIRHFWVCQINQTLLGQAPPAQNQTPLTFSRSLAISFICKIGALVLAIVTNPERKYGFNIFFFTSGLIFLLSSLRSPFFFWLDHQHDGLPLHMVGLLLKMSELTGPICSGDDGEPFCSEKGSQVFLCQMAYPKQIYFSKKQSCTF